MEVIIVGDQSKMIENFTKAMFDITLQRIKNNDIKFDKKESSPSK
ncbi:hypothetical protein [Clostridium magnum]|uniref:Uncharacterized protein n=1 Tax=Clostridium magnum DSM 2767 TaxID=1121326 RepID=A0A162QFT1_9CLOT|nr:hypothetical protein [Clostridium magnum]KZL88491.1 hypothetical protein CLMAG_61460 [Clostridium magnum DSM 2767]SHJ11557.1 hypothetical protein SAMN02745944_05366 [Clostridium magnum DSM 2767]